MNSAESLQTAIIRYVMEKMGFSSLSNSIPSIAFRSKEALLSRRLKVEVDGSPTERACYCAELAVATQAMRAIVTSLPEEGFFDEAVVYRFGEGVSYGMRLSTDPVDVGDFLVRDQNGNWNPVPTLLQATCLAGFEKLNSYALNWKRSEQSENMFENLVEFLKAGEMR